LKPIGAQKAPSFHNYENLGVRLIDGLRISLRASHVVWLIFVDSLYKRGLGAIKEYVIFGY
jgi:hypothetical protein